MVTNYDTIDGRIRAETTGGVRTGYLPDALGSVTATVQDGVVVNTYRYKPYGAQLAKTGAGADPKFLWNGQHGYRQTGVGIADTYIRARHYARQAGQWLSVDPIWPNQSAYVAANSSPVMVVDRLGLKPAPFSKQPESLIPPPPGTNPGCSCPSGEPTDVPCPDCMVIKPGAGIGRQGPYRKDCYRLVCKSYCEWETIRDKNMMRCTTGLINVRALNDLYTPCAIGSAEHKFCGEMLGLAHSDVGANKSNYPEPIPQTSFNMDLGGEFCALECMMRVCCSWQSRLGAAKQQMMDGFRDCDRWFDAVP